MLLIIILTFMIIILLYFLKNKETFNIDKNKNKQTINDHKIIMFFTGGLCEEAHCIHR